MDTDDREIGHDLLLEYVMGDLDEEDTVRFERHLARCSRCRTDALALLPVHAELLTMYPDVAPHENAGQAKSAVLQYAFSRRLPNRPTDLAGAPSLPPLTIATPRRRFAGFQGWRPFHRMVLAGATVGVLALGAIFTWNEHAERLAVPVPSSTAVGRKGAGAAQIVAGSHGAQGASPAWSTGAGQASGAGTSRLQPLATMLHPTSAFFGARGLARVVTEQRVRRLVVRVSEVPIQSRLGCYDVWQEYDGHLHSLGEFLVNSRGEGQIAITLQGGGPQGRIVVTLEPRWGDSKPLGPTVLKGRMVSS